MKKIIFTLFAIIVTSFMASCSNSDDFIQNKSLSQDLALCKLYTAVDKDVQEDFLASSLFNEAYDQLNYATDKTLQLRDICNKIINNDLCVDEDKIVEYGEKVNDLIIDSEVSDETKTELQIANNLAVNSSLYWDDK